MNLNEMSHFSERLVTAFEMAARRNHDLRLMSWVAMQGAQVLRADEVFAHRWVRIVRDV